MEAAGDSNNYIGRYRCISYLGSGGMADVFKCELQGIGGFGKLFVVKRMKHELVNDEEHVSMFLDEARLVARIQHPNVVQVFEVDAVDNIPFIAMELVRGPTLSQLARAARKRNDVRPDLFVRIAADVALGLAAAHGALGDNGQPLNIVHRDVSPQNIMIGLGGSAKILDFGIAKADGKLGKTATGLLKGKVAYMSPEQVNIKDIDARSDIYSLGVCLYQAIIGHLPFRGTNDFEVLRARMGGDYTPASVVRPDVSPALTSLIDRALAENPDDRFSSALEFHEELETWLLDEGTTDRRALSAWVTELFPDVDALVAGRPVSSMGTMSTVPTTQTLTPTSQPSASRSSFSGSSFSGPSSFGAPVVVREPMRETAQTAQTEAPVVFAPQPRRLAPVVAGGFAALATGLGVFIAMRGPAPSVTPPVAPPVVVSAPPVPAPVPPPVPVAPVVEPVEPVTAFDDADLGSLDDIEATTKPAAAKAKPKPLPPKPVASTPVPVSLPPPATPSVEPSVEPPVETAPPAPPPPPVVPSPTPPTPVVTPAPAPAVLAPEPPQLPKQKRVLQVKELVAACTQIEAELERRGHLPASRVRNVTAPLARALASKLVDGDAIELPVTSIYWFLARQLSGTTNPRSAVAAALVEAYQSNSLR